MQTMLLHNRQSPMRFYYFTKRCLDLGVASLMLVLLSPLLLLNAVLIKLDTPGPAIFRQERVGSRRRTVRGSTTWEVHTFTMYKFRSMVDHADPEPHQAFIRAFAEGHVDGHAGREDQPFKLSEDPRVTRVGRVLRLTSLDELPQLVNVLKGEMSLVGPRPVPHYEAANYRREHLERLAAQPGITGLWQVTGRSQVSFEDMIRMDVQYVRKRSLWLDIKILLLTIPAALAAKGAA